MSTRSAIARKTADGFAGVYHHWDGYPSGLGSTLFDVRNRIFVGDTARMLRYLIDKHPGGWSTINADWSKPAGPRPDDNLSICKECCRPAWEHYSQYYKGGYSDEPSYWELAGRPELPSTNPNEILVFGHSVKRDDHETHGPEPFGKSEAWVVTHENASGSGCEWAYVFDDAKPSLMEIQCSFCDPRGKFAGHKMIGMFGCGDEAGIWKPVAIVDLDGKAPAWENIKPEDAVAA